MHSGCQDCRNGFCSADHNGANAFLKSLIFLQNYAKWRDIEKTIINLRNVSFYIAEIFNTALIYPKTAKVQDWFEFLKHLEYTHKFGLTTKNVKNCWLGVKILNLSHYILHKSFDSILRHRTAKLRWWQGKKPFVHYIVMPHHIKYWHL